MRHMSIAVYVVIVVCAISILVILEAVFRIFGMPTEMRHWTLAACALAPILYFLIMRFINSHVTPHR